MFNRPGCEDISAFLEIWEQYEYRVLAREFGGGLKCQVRATALT